AFAPDGSDGPALPGLIVTLISMVLSRAPVATRAVAALIVACAAGKAKHSRHCAAGSWLADLALLAALLLRQPRRAKTLEHRPVVIAAGGAALDRVRRAILRIALAFVPFPRVMHLLHTEAPDCDTVAHDDSDWPCRTGKSRSVLAGMCWPPSFASSATSLWPTPGT